MSKEILLIEESTIFYTENHEAEDAEFFASMNLNWLELSRQKLKIAKLGSALEKAGDHSGSDLLEGVLCLIDHLQDEGIRHGQPVVWHVSSQAAYIEIITQEITEDGVLV